MKFTLTAMPHLLLALPLVFVAGCDSAEKSAAPAGRTEVRSPATQPAPEPATEPAPQPAQDAWVTLFDGTDVERWRNLDGSQPLRAFQLTDGTLHRHQGGGDVYFDEVFADFDLIVEWKVAPGANSGIFFRVNDLRQVWQTGLEVQVLDNQNHGDGRNPLTSAGALYGLIPAATDVTRPVGEWNVTRIVAHDNKVESHLNGILVASLDLDDEAYAVPQGKFPYPWQALKREGYIVLQDHGDAVWYRNIRLRKI